MSWLHERIEQRVGGIQLVGGDWVRADIIVSIYVERGDDNWQVKLRCQPNPYAWNPIQQSCQTLAEAHLKRDELAQLLWGGA